jgi:hypothetical protein
VKPPTVLIDGVRYVPVSEAHIKVGAIEDAIIGEWAGSDWRTHYPEAIGYLRIVVTDDETEGMTVHQFAARILEAASDGSP